jgi:outer membrane protein assembly factor BamB
MTINKILYPILIIVILICGMGCEKKTKIKKLPGQYTDLMQEINYAKPDSVLAEKPVMLPGAQPNNQWLSSNFSLVSIPENIKIEPPLANKISNYRLLHSHNIYGASITPVVEKGILYIADNKGFVAAYNTQNFSKALWTTQIFRNLPLNDNAGGGFSLYEDMLVVTFGNDYLIALDKNTGSEIWHYNLSNVTRAAPTIKNGKVLVLTIDNRLYCLNVHTGELIWTHEGAIEQLGVFGSASPAVSEKLVIVPHSSGQLHALDINSGQLVWQLNLIKNTNNSTMLYLNDIDMTPIINNGTVYISNYAGTMFAIELTSGQMKWYNDTIGGTKFAWIAKDYIYSVNKFNQLTASLKQTGQIKWVVQIANTNSKSKNNKLIINGPIMVNNILYLTTTEGKLLTYDPITGNELGEYKISKAVYSPPIAVDNNIYFINDTGTLSVLR